MNQKAAVQEIWESFLASLPPEASEPAGYSAWYFCDNEQDANELGELVLNGVKYGTASLLWNYESGDEALPEVGAVSVVTDWNGRPLCIIETTEVEVLPFDRVSAEHAFSEGEGDRSLAYWREVHWRFFSRECVRLGRQPFMEMPVVCERFKLIYRPREN